MQLVISDHHKGLQNSNDTFRGPLGSIVKHTFIEISEATPPKHQRQVADALKDVFNAPDRNTAQKRLSDMMDTYENVLPTR